MSRDFYWFKDMEYVKREYWFRGRICETYKPIFYDVHDTSHSVENIGKVQEMLEKYDCRIPSISYINVPSERPCLIRPSDMYIACCKILNSEMKYPEMRERIEWFKKLSEQNYFLAYEGMWFKEYEGIWGLSSDLHEF